ncbi:MAG: hypothetical protein QGI09_04560, partial [Dehalococcoidia bacterium]|nr:hypothetical protein [Dehalococcoidia bacterium]
MSNLACGARWSIPSPSVASNPREPYGTLLNIGVLLVGFACGVRYPAKPRKTRLQLPKIDHLGIDRRARDVGSPPPKGLDLRHGLVVRPLDTYIHCTIEYTPLAAPAGGG